MLSVDPPSASSMVPSSALASVVLELSRTLPPDDPSLFVGQIVAKAQEYQARLSYLQDVTYAQNGDV